jgi:hypothetical protein
MSHIEELCSMSKRAVHYYLPCFLKRVLIERDDFEFTIGMISLLNMDWFKMKWECDFWPDFSAEQGQAIQDTVAFVRQHIKSYHLGEFVSEYRDRLQAAGHQWRRLNFGSKTQ